MLGELDSVPEPDVVIILGTPEQIHLLTRSYCYATGSFVMGYAGMGACRMLLPHAILNNELVFTISDRAWRKALQIAPDELTLATPVDKLRIMIENLEDSQK